MALKTILFLGLFGACCVGAVLVSPLWGVLGYVANYAIGPERQWWAAPVRHWGLRYSYLLAVFTAIGILLHYRSLRFGKKLITRQEWLILLFLGLVWLSVLIGEPTEFYTRVDHPSVKITKMIIFALMMTHVVTTKQRLNALLWVLIVAAWILGLQAYTTGSLQWTRGRLETVGGPDFAESNFLAAYLAAMLPLIGVQFLRSGWVGRAVCLLSGVFATNAIILTRSRGAVVGIAGGALVALLLAPKKHRLVILASLIVAGAGAYYLMDPGFVDRASTITVPEEERDASASSRFEIWRASVRMLSDHPLGIGAGNFFQTIGRYSPEHEGRDSHNTFVRCYSELGVQGIAVLAAMVVSAVFALRRAMKEAASLAQPDRDQITYAAYGLMVSLATILGCGLTITLLYNEILWWVLALPVCLERVLANVKADAVRATLADETSAADRFKRRKSRRVRESAAGA